MSSPSPVNQNESVSDSSEEATSSVASDVSNPKKKVLTKKFIKKENGEYKELDYLIYMAQFSAPEKTDQYYVETMKKPQCSMSIYPRGYDKKPITQREEMMLPSTFRERSYTEVWEQAEKSLEELEKK